MDSAALTQMNVRIDASLKTAGDEALSSIGFSPTQAVRALWEHAAQRGEQLEEVRRFLNSGSEGANRNPKIDALETGWQIIPAGLAALGISAGALANASNNLPTLREEALSERAQEKGWF